MTAETLKNNQAKKSIQALQEEARQKAIEHLDKLGLTNSLNEFMESLEHFAQVTIPDVLGEMEEASWEIEWDEDELDDLIEEARFPLDQVAEGIETVLYFLEAPKDNLAKIWKKLRSTLEDEEKNDEADEP